MNFDVNEDNIEWIIRNLNDAMGNGQFSTGEVVVGLAQFTGRMITALADTPVSGFQVAQAMGEEIKRTLIAGYTAKGFNVGGENANS